MCNIGRGLAKRELDIDRLWSASELFLGKYILCEGSTTWVFMIVEFVPAV